MAAEVLNRATLVLNRNWQAIHVTTVVRALVMLWNETAQVVEPDEYRTYSWEGWVELEPPPDAPCIRSARVRLRVPEVVCLTHYDRLPATAVTFSRRNVARRDHHTCQYCGAQPGWERITIDHVVPRSQGGVSSWTNCVAACPVCNARRIAKSERTKGKGQKTEENGREGGPAIGRPLRSPAASVQTSFSALCPLLSTIFDFAILLSAMPGRPTARPSKPGCT